MMKTGDPVRVRREGSSDEWCRAVVAMASENGESIGLLLEGAVRDADGEGLILGALPLIVDYERETVEAIFGGAYEIEVLT